MKHLKATGHSGNANQPKPKQVRPMISNFMLDSNTEEEEMKQKKPPISADPADPDQ